MRKKLTYYRCRAHDERVSPDYEWNVWRHSDGQPCTEIGAYLVVENNIVI